MSLNLNGDHMIDDFIFNEEFKGEIPESMAAVIGVLGKEDAYILQTARFSDFENS